MLSHIVSRGLLPAREGCNPLKSFALEARTRVCALLLEDLVRGDEILPRLDHATQSDPQLQFLLQVMTHTLCLPTHEVASAANISAQKALVIYHQWLAQIKLPSCILHDKENVQVLLRRCMEHLSLIFEYDQNARAFELPYEKRDISTKTSRGEDKKMNYESHLDLCQRALRTFEAVLLRAEAGTCDLVEESWSHLLCVLLGIADRLLAPATNKLGDVMELQLVHMVLGAHIASTKHIGMQKATWYLLATYMQRWAHREAVVATWHGAVVSLAALLQKDLRSQREERAKRKARGFLSKNGDSHAAERDRERTKPSAENDDSNSERRTRMRTRGTADLQVSSYPWYLRESGPDNVLYCQLSQPILHFVFIHAVHLIGNPNRIQHPSDLIASPEVHLRAMYAVSHLCAILLGDSDEEGNHPKNRACESSVIDKHKASDNELRSSSHRFEGQEQQGPSSGSTVPFFSPHINTVLRLLGGWLADAALNPLPTFRDTRAVALLTLGHIFCEPRRSGGRTPLPVLGHLKGKCNNQTEHRVDVTVSAKPLIPHAVRYLLSIRAALHIEHGTPETVVAVLRASSGILGSGLKGSRLLLRDLNYAVEKVLKSHTPNAPNFSVAFRNANKKDLQLSKDPGSFAFFNSGSLLSDAVGIEIALNSSSLTSTQNSDFKPLKNSNKIASEQASPKFCTRFPIHGWLGKRLGPMSSALRDKPGQRSWCAQVLVSECCLPTHFADSFEISASATKDKEQEKSSSTLNTFKNLRMDLVRHTSLAIKLAGKANLRGDRGTLQGLMWTFSVLVHDAAVSKSAPHLLAPEAGIMGVFETIVAPYLRDRLWPFPGTSDSSPQSASPKRNNVRSRVHNHSGAALNGSNEGPKQTSIFFDALDSYHEYISKEQSFHHHRTKGSTNQKSSVLASEGGDIVLKLDVDIPHTVIEVISSIRLHSEILQVSCPSTIRRILNYLTTYITRLAMWHFDSMSDFPWSTSPEDEVVNDEAEREANTELSESSAKWLKDLDKAIRRQRQALEQGDGYRHSAGLSLLQRLSPPAAETLGAGLECLRLWIIEACWTVLGPTKGVVFTGTKQESAEDTQENLEASSLLSSIALAAVACGAFVSTATPPQRSHAGTVAEYLRGLPPHAARIGYLATQLLEALERHVGSHPFWQKKETASSPRDKALSSLASYRAISTLVTEERVMASFAAKQIVVSAQTSSGILNGRDSTRQMRQRCCRYFLVKGSVVVTFIESSYPYRNDDEIIIIARDGFSRQSWSVRCLDLIPTPNTDEVIRPKIQKKNRFYDHVSYLKNRPFVADPLLGIICQTQQYKTKLTNIFDEEIARSEFFPLPSEASNILKEFRAEQSVLRPVKADTKDSVASDGNYESNLFIDARPPAAMKDAGESAVENPISKEPNRSHMEKTRLVMAALFGVTSPENFKSILLLCGSDAMIRKLDSLDIIPERESSVVFLAFARNCGCVGRELNIEIVGRQTYRGNPAQRQQQCNKIQDSLPVDWHLFLTGLDPFEVLRENSFKAKINSIERDPVLGAACRGLGAAIDPLHHKGFDGGVNLEDLASSGSPLLYYADSGRETVFLDTTRPVLVKTWNKASDDKEKFAPEAYASNLLSAPGDIRPFMPPSPILHTLFEHEHPVETSISVNLPLKERSHGVSKDREVDGQVLILWNECVQQCAPNSEEWRLYGFESENNDHRSSKFALIIIIDPLEDGLYRTRIYGDGPTFTPGQLSPLGTNNSMLGPLTHGMVVSRRLLGPLVRQTAINASKMLASHKRRSQLQRFLDSTTKLYTSSEKQTLDVRGWKFNYEHSDDLQWSCPFDARSKALSTLPRHALKEHNESFGSLLRALIAPPEILTSD